LKLVDVSNSIYNFVVNTLLKGTLKGAFLVWIAKKLVDRLAKPLYDWVIRKGYITVKKIEVKTLETNLKNAQTKEERDKAIDEMP
jgi:hypothetical protein